MLSGFQWIFRPIPALWTDFGMENALECNEMMMKVGISVWEGRISPVLDGCGRFLVLDIEDAREVAREEVELSETYLPFRARAIADLGVDVLICGPVSRPLAAMLADSAIALIGRANGGVYDVLRAFLNKELHVTDFGTLVGIGAGRGGRRFRHGRCARFFNKGGEIR